MVALTSIWGHYLLYNQYLMKSSFFPKQASDRPSGSFEDQITTLHEEIDLAIKWDRPSILLAVYPSEIINLQAQESLARQIERIGQKVSRIKVDKENFDLAWFLSQFDWHQDVVFFISGLRWGGGRSRSNAYQALNMRREIFVENKIRMVIWLNQKEASDLPHHAPDFWAFRHRVVEFPENPAAHYSPYREVLSWRDWQINETDKDLESRIALRESMLADLPVNDTSLFNRTDLTYELAFLYWCQHDFDRASTYVEKGLALTSHPQAVSLKLKFLIAKGMLYHDQYLLENAGAIFQQVLEQQPRNPAAWNNLALVYQDQGRHVDALHAFKEAIRLSPRYANAWNNLGNFHLEDANLPEALHAYKQATRFEPQNAKPWINLAQSHLDAGQPDLAIRAYKKAIRLVPENITLLNELGNIYRGMNRFKDAIAAYNKAIKLAPDYIFPYAGLVASYRQTGRGDNADKHLALAKPLLESKSALTRAEFEAICGNNQQALQYLQIALDENRINPDSIRTNPNFIGLHSDTRFKILFTDK